MLVIPFRAGGKSRLPASIRVDVALAMLGDVCAAVSAHAVAPGCVVTDDPAAASLAESFGLAVVTDPGGGQGAAVAAALRRVSGPCVVLNADLPAATSADVDELWSVAAAAAFALVEAADGTTNALALPSPLAFAPLFGPGSASRFRAHAAALGLPVVEVAAPGLVTDVDTLADLERLDGEIGTRTGALLETPAR